tara:strand:+ start:1311 stop:1946 length:636 start_codon:yes stop_codon:yes gene_type:complete
MPVNITDKDEVFDDNFWNQLYKKELVPWSNAPANLLKNFVEYLPKGAKILDLGCGRGRNSFFLERLGFEVLGLDISETAIQQAKDKNSKCKFKVFDLMHEEWPKDFDAVIDFGFYHFLPSQYRKEYVSKLNNTLNNKGIYCQQSGRNDIEHSYNRIPGEYVPPELNKEDIVFNNYTVILCEELTIPPHDHWGKYPCWNLIARKNFENSNNF